MGWLSLGSFRAVALRLNVTLVVGALAFGLFRFAPGAWVGFLVTIFAHAFGHAATIRLTGHRLSGVHLHALGGSCDWTGRTTPLERATIAWGGVLGQLILFATALGVRLTLGPPRAAWLADLEAALLWPNLVAAGLNLVPIRALDGAEAWRLPGAILRRRRAARRFRPTLFLGPESDRAAREVLERACEIVQREAEEARTRRDRVV